MMRSDDQPEIPGAVDWRTLTGETPKPRYTKPDLDRIKAKNRKNNKTARNQRRINRRTHV